MVLDIPVKISNEGKAHEVRVASAPTEHFPDRLAILAFPKLNFLYLSTEYTLFLSAIKKQLLFS